MIGFPVGVTASGYGGLRKLASRHSEPSKSAASYSHQLTAEQAGKWKGPVLQIDSAYYGFTSSLVLNNFGNSAAYGTVYFTIAEVEDDRRRALLGDDSDTDLLVVGWEAASLDAGWTAFGITFPGGMMPDLDIAVTAANCDSTITAAPACANVNPFQYQITARSSANITSPTRPQVQYTSQVAGRTPGGYLAGTVVLPWPKCFNKPGFPTTDVCKTAVDFTVAYGPWNFATTKPRPHPINDGATLKVLKPRTHTLFKYEL